MVAEIREACGDLALTMNCKADTEGLLRKKKKKIDSLKRWLVLLKKTIANAVGRNKFCNAVFCPGLQTPIGVTTVTSFGRVVAPTGSL
jgi:hypothetical protein